VIHCFVSTRWNLLIYLNANMIYFEEDQSAGLVLSIDIRLSLLLRLLTYLYPHLDHDHLPECNHRYAI
jgi:hypothetical protein